MKRILLLVIVLSSIKMYGQDTVYYNAIGAECSKNDVFDYYSVTEKIVSKTKSIKNIKTVSRSFYASGKKRGIYNHYTAEDTLLAQTKDSAAIEKLSNGDAIRWYENGQVKFEKKYVNGNLEGKLVSFYASGKKKREAVYKQNELVSGKMWNEDQKEIEYTPYYVDAEYNGGISALRSYLINNLMYPDDARENGIKGRVILRFVVDKEGNVSDIKVEKKVFKSLDAEAIRVVRRMSKWKPATEDDEPVSSYYRLPVNFSLE